MAPTRKRSPWYPVAVVGTLGCALFVGVCLYGFAIKTGELGMF